MTIFDVKALLIAFLNNPLKMRKENFAPSNYDIFSGKAKIPPSTIDEIHTGSLREPVRRKYCGDNPDAFPLALVCFYDGPEGCSLYCLNLDYRAPPGRFFRLDLTGW